MEVLKEKLRNVQPIEVGITSVLFIIGVILSWLKFSESKVITVILLYLFIIAGFIGGVFIWQKTIERYFNKVVYFLTEHNFGRKVVAGGTFSYFQYQDPDEETVKSKIFEPLLVILQLLFVFLGIAVTIMSFLGENAVLKPVLWGVMAILAPILATPLVPVNWALRDTKIKAWNEKNKTTWMVYKKYRALFNSFISIAAIASNLRGGLAGSLRDKLTQFGGILEVGILVMIVPTALFTISYYAWFKELLTTKTKSTLSLPTYDVNYVEKEAQFPSEETQEKTMEDEPESVTSEDDETEETEMMEEEETTSTPETDKGGGEEEAETEDMNNDDESLDEELSNSSSEEDKDTDS